MAETNQKEVLLGLVQGDLKPALPKPEEDTARFDKWRRDLYGYLDKVLGRFTATNIYNTIVQAIGPAPFGGISAPGIGPLLLEIYADATWTAGTDPFNGTKIGEIKVPSSNLEKLNLSLFIGSSKGPPNSNLFKACRLTGQIVPNVTEDHNFEVIHDDGARLYINNVLVINNWAGPGTDNTGGSPIPLTAGVPATFKLEVINSAGSDFDARLFWYGAGETGGFYSDIPYSALRAP
jgi:hypothetical protein